MRIALFVLLLLNLLYFAYTQWVAPQPTLVASPPPKVARILLASEAPPVPQAAPKPQCVTVGPFAELGEAARAGESLDRGGSAPRMRELSTERADGYVVMVANLQNADQQLAMLRRLRQAGFNDAVAAPNAADQFALAAGEFPDRERADRRASALRRAGIAVTVAERMRPATVYWVDLDVAPAAGEDAVATLRATLRADTQLEIMPCPDANAAAEAAPAQGGAPADAPGPVP